MKTWARVGFMLAAPFALALANSPFGGIAVAAPKEAKVSICHRPPGNPGNAHVITVGASAVASHVANHGDNVCAPGDSNCCGGGGGCPPGETLCGTQCVNTQTDENNCGACGNVCPSDQECVAGACVPTGTGAACGLPASSLSVLIEGSTVTAYVPLGSWSETTTTGVHVVPLEPAGASTTVPTTAPVNSCSSNSVTGTTVCTGNSNDVYVINGTTLSSTATAGATGAEFFSGGGCETCGVAFDVITDKAWIAEGAAIPDVGALQAFNPSTSTFDTPIGLFGQETSEDIAVDPVRHLILSANEGNQWQIINSTTGVVYNSTTPFVSPEGGVLDSTAEDCSTGVALAPFEFAQSVAFVNLTGATYTGGSPGVSPGTWTAPTNVQSFAPDFTNLSAGASGSAVAPGSHFAVITGEFGGAGFGVLQLPSTVTATTIPAAVDWVSANVPNTPPPLAIPWSMGLDPHTVTAYVSPNDNKAYALMSNIERTFLVKVDMAMLLAAPRLAGTHTADPTTAAYAASFTFVAQ